MAGRRLLTLVCESLTKSTSSRFRIRFEELVDDGIEIHQPRVLAQVVFRFGQEQVDLPIGSLDRDLPWFGQRIHNLDLLKELYDTAIKHQQYNQGIQVSSRTVELRRILWEGLVISGRYTSWRETSNYGLLQRDNQI